MANVKITARNNGPLRVEGPIDLYYGETRIEVKDPAVSLCRCGGSSNKPFCDGTHNKIGFKASAEAIPGSKEK